MSSSETLEFVGATMPANEKRELFDLAYKRRTTASALIRHARQTFSVGKAMRSAAGRRDNAAKTATAVPNVMPEILAKQAVLLEMA